MILTSDNPDRLILVAPTPGSNCGQIDCTFDMIRSIKSSNEATVDFTITRCSGLTVAFTVWFYGSEIPAIRTDPFQVTTNDLMLQVHRRSSTDATTMLSLTFSDFDITSGDVVIAIPAVPLDDDRLRRIQDFFIDMRDFLDCSDPGLGKWAL